MPKLPHRAKEMLEVIDSDVCGPMQSTTFSGKRYFVTFTDKYSHFTTVFLLKNKSEIADKLLSLLRLLNLRLAKLLKLFAVIMVASTLQVKWPSSVSGEVSSKRSHRLIPHSLTEWLSA